MTDPKTDVWMPLWIGSYLADTMKLTTVQHGAYFLLLMAYWRERSPLKDSDDELRSITKTDRAEWKKMRPVIAEFFKVADGVWWHKRVEQEMAAADARSRKSTGTASSGGLSRWGEVADETKERGRHLRGQRLAEARKKGVHTANEWDAMKSYHGMRCVRCQATDCELVKDHIQPLYQGGSDGLENIQPLCRKCNASKGPESTDHRLDGWNEGIKRLLECLPNAFVMPTSLPSPSPTELRSVKKSADAPPIPGIPDELLRDFLEVRKAKRAGKLTPTAIKGLEREAAKAGLTLFQAITVCCEAGWQGFRADWYATRTSSGAMPAWREQQRTETQKAAPSIALGGADPNTFFANLGATNVPAIGLD